MDPNMFTHYVYTEERHTDCHSHVVALVVIFRHARRVEGTGKTVAASPKKSDTLLKTATSTNTFHTLTISTL